jgi:hypothetical protein
LPGRGLLTVACLVFVALACISVVRKLERERRLLRKLRSRGAADAATAIPLSALTDDERDCALALGAAGVLIIRQKHCHLKSAELPLFRRKRVRLALSGALGALLLCVLIVVVILRR